MSTPTTTVPLADQSLHVAEIFESIQGEGVQAGFWSTFIRFQGCSVGCSWCDTKYTWEFGAGTPMTLAELWDKPRTHRLIFTGGEPVQQPRKLMDALVAGFIERGHHIQVETSGRFFAPWLEQIQWRTVSPKPPTYAIEPRLFDLCDELKYVVDDDFDPSVVPDDPPAGCVVSLQPEGNKPPFIDKTLKLLKTHTDWRLSMQLHKVLQLP